MTLASIVTNTHDGLFFPILVAVLVLVLVVDIFTHRG